MTAAADKDRRRGCTRGLDRDMTMTPELTAAIERARNHVMTPEEVFEQRVSFVYGGMSSSSTLTKDDVRAMLTKSQGQPPAPAGYALVPIEPTEAMVAAGINSDQWGDNVLMARLVRETWSAMIHVALAPPSQS